MGHNSRGSSSTTKKGKSRSGVGHSHRVRGGVMDSMRGNSKSGGLTELARVKSACSGEKQKGGLDVQVKLGYRIRHGSCRVEAQDATKTDKNSLFTASEARGLTGPRTPRGAKMSSVKTAKCDLDRLLVIVVAKYITRTVKMATLARQ